MLIETCLSACKLNYKVISLVHVIKQLALDVPGVAAKHLC